jgi:hypothetical protein
VIQFCVIKTVEKMDRSRTACSQANPDFAGKLGMGAGHKSGHLFVPYLDIIDLFARSSDSSNNPVDSIPRKSVNATNVPFNRSSKKSLTVLLIIVLAGDGLGFFIEVMRPITDGFGTHILPFSLADAL